MGIFVELSGFIKNNFDEQKVLESFWQRQKNTTFDRIAIATELEALASSEKVSLDELFVMAETDQLSPDLADQVMSFFSIIKTLK